MPLATDALLADTTHLSTIEFGAYMRLLVCMWRNSGSLSTDEKELQKFARLTPAQWGRIWPVLEGFFYVEDDLLKQGKVTDLLSSVRRKSKSRSLSARARWRNNKGKPNANAPVLHMQNDAIQDPYIKESDHPPKKRTSFKASSDIVNELGFGKITGEEKA